MSLTSVVFGASGYSGLELLTHLARHPGVRVVGASSDRWAGRAVDEVAHGVAADLHFVAHDALLTQDADVAFLATPAEVSAKLAPALLLRGIRVIDLSGAFRLKDVGRYPGVYGFEHPLPALVAEAHYGLPELVGAPARSTRLVANPGCYATAAALAVAPIVSLLEGTVFLDGKSGTSGAGRRSEEPYSFTEVANTIRPYKVTGHQHVPEIEQTIGRVVSFVPHLIPLPRGLTVTAQATLAAGVTAADVAARFQAAYRGKAFVRVVLGAPELSRTLHTNFVEVGFAVDERTRTVVAMAALDNLVKGAAGQAIQNLNLLFGFDETVALGAVPK